jgi:PAS domain S-box-containing protein
VSRRAARPGRASRRANPSRAALLAELADVQAQLGELVRFRELRHELEVEREEVAVQRDQLLDSHRELEASRGRYVELFDFAPIPYVTHDAFGVVIELNLQAGVLFGVERQRLIGWPLTGFVARESKADFLRHLARCRAGAELAETELVISTRSRRRVHVAMTSRPVPMNEERVYSAAIIDLSERDHAASERERVLEERQRVEREQHAALAASNAVDHFLAVLGHELRTPLTPILLGIETALRRGVVPEHMRPLFDLIRRNVELEGRLVDDLLDVTRIRQGRLRLEFEPLDLNEIVGDVCRSSMPTAEAAGIALGYTTAAERSWVSGDPPRLRQVCWNLLQNAIRNTPAGGRIDVRTENLAGTVVVRVTDTGRGITPERLAGIFKPFTHTPGGREGPGLGIGLSISRSLVEAHHGHITATSPGTGRGATLEVELPTIERPAVQLAPGREPVDTRRLSVLLVEDNEDNAVALADLLALHGFRVARASTVAAALERAPGEYDVIVSDLGLPDGSGLDIVRRLRGDAQPVRAIALSGYGTARDVEQSLAAGFTLHLTKPVDPDALVSAIRRVAS